MTDTFQSLVGEFNAFIDAHPRYRDMGDALELLMGAELTPDEFQWLTTFCERWDVMQDESVAFSICQKWIEKCGLGFHPDTRGADYVPALSADEAAQCDRDMDRLFTLKGDPYAAAVSALEAWEARCAS